LSESPSLIFFYQYNITHQNAYKLNCCLSSGKWRN